MENKYIKMETSKKIGVMHVILDLIPGGAERVVLNYLKFHDRNRFIPMVCVLRHLADAEKMELIQGNIEYYFLNKGDGFKPEAIYKLFGLLKNQRIDVLHLHNFSAILYGTIAGVIAKTPVIIQTEHNVVNKPCTIGSRTRGYLKLLLGLFCKRIITVSDQVNKSQKKRNFLAREKFRTIRNGVDITSFENILETDSLREELGIDKKKIVVTKIASLTEQKGHEILIEAAGIIIEKNRDVIFLIVGDGPRKEELIELVNEKELSNYFIFTGIRNDIPKIFKITDIFVLSSHWEGLPITVLEAMASKIPVVVTDVGGNEEVVLNNKTGIIVPPNSPIGLGKALNILIHDKDLRIIYGKNARKRLEENFTAEIMTETTEKLYIECFSDT